MPEEQDHEIPEEYSMPYEHYPSYPPAPPDLPTSPPMASNAPYPSDITISPTGPLPQPYRTNAPAKRKSFWLPASIIAIVVIISLLSIFWYVLRPTPDKTLDTFCTALIRKDYSTAYAQFSPKLQKTFSEATFATYFTPDNVVTCSHSTTSATDTSVTSIVQLIHTSKKVNTDAMTVIKDTNNNWKIENVYRQG